MTVFKQEIKGLYKDESLIPNVSGVYFVYIAYRGEGMVYIAELIYIGESDKIGDRIVNHEKRTKWEERLTKKTELRYAYTEIDEKYREHLEAAYIYEHQPICNTQGKDSFKYEKTRVISDGSTTRLNKDFTLERMEG